MWGWGKPVADRRLRAVDDHGRVAGHGERHGHRRLGRLAVGRVDAEVQAERRARLGALGGHLADAERDLGAADLALHERQRVDRQHLVAVGSRAAGRRVRLADAEERAVLDGDARRGVLERHRGADDGAEVRDAAVAPAVDADALLAARHAAGPAVDGDVAVVVDGLRVALDVARRRVQVRGRRPGDGDRLGADLGALGLVGAGVGEGGRRPDADAEQDRRGQGEGTGRRVAGVHERSSMRGASFARSCVRGTGPRMEAPGMNH